MRTSRGLCAAGVLLAAAFCAWFGRTRPLPTPTKDPAGSRPVRTERPADAGPAQVAALALAPRPVSGASGVLGAGATSVSWAEAWMAPGTARPVPAAEPAFSAFRGWSEVFLASPEIRRQALEADGILRAERRRGKMSDLIEVDPKRAWELRVPAAVRRQLPAAVAALLETEVSGRGSLAVLAADGPESSAAAAEAAPARWHVAVVGGREYRAFVYGRRLGEPTREGIALNGLVLGDRMAVHESPLRVLAAAEAPASTQPTTCAVCGAAADADLAAENGGAILGFCSPVHIAQFETAAIAEEVALGPLATDGTRVDASAWTEGIKRLILIRVDFSDLQGESFSEETATNIVKQVHQFYQENSYGKAGFAQLGDGATVTPLFRMPRTAAYYGTNDAGQLRRDARVASTAAGFDLTRFDLDATCFRAVPGFRWAGLGYVGAAGAWIRDTASAGVVAHELGHNLGLGHANFWDTAGESVIGPGNNIAYGDTFDTMGSATAGAKHFNTRWKSLLNWIPTNQVAVARQSGSFVLRPQDDPGGVGLLALRIARGGNTNYWFEFRRANPANAWLMNGLGLRWGFSGNQDTLLLDTTPGSAAGKTDSPITLGHTFSDLGAGIHVTPVAEGGAPPPSIEVVVNLGTFPDNHAPRLTLAADAAQTAVGAPVAFTASATDPDGDRVVYAWDFADGGFTGDAARVSHAWTAAGDYALRCEASDLKGGHTSRMMVVRVGAPSTYRIEGRVLGEAGPLEGVRVYVSSAQVALTDGSGRYALTGLGAGAYNLKVGGEGYLFSALGFTNAVRVGPSQTNLDFFALPASQRTLEVLVPRGSIWQYLDDGSDQGVNWRTPAFDDHAWSEGAAPLGYGDASERTPVRFGPNANQKYVTTYFRRGFTVADPAAYSGLVLNLRRDDGAVVYLNGHEILRGNMPGGPILYTTLASATVGGADETRFFEADLDTSRLLKGTNLLAVEIHQASRSSSDIVFDLDLAGTRPASFPAPKLAWQSSPGGLRLSWPEVPPGARLFRAATLAAGGAWTPIPDPGTAQDGRRLLDIRAADASQFYRLQRE